MPRPAYGVALRPQPRRRRAWLPGLWTTRQRSSSAGTIGTWFRQSTAACTRGICAIRPRFLRALRRHIRLVPGEVLLVLVRDPNGQQRIEAVTTLWATPTAPAGDDEREALVASAYEGLGWSSGTRRAWAARPTVVTVIPRFGRAFVRRSDVEPWLAMRYVNGYGDIVVVTRRGVVVGEEVARLSPRLGSKPPSELQDSRRFHARDGSIGCARGSASPSGRLNVALSRDLSLLAH